MRGGDDAFDWLIIGAGAAGCTLVARAAGQLGSIGLVEAGENHIPTASRRPAEYMQLFGSSCDWAYQTCPQPRLAGRAIRWPRGRMVGGSSGINAMIHIRPLDADLARWSRSVAAWSQSSWKSPLDWLQARWEPLTGGGETSEITRRTIGAGRRCGYPLDAYPRAIRFGRRRTPRMLLEPHRDRVTILSGLAAQSLGFDDRGVRSVRCRTATGTFRSITARCGVVLAAGAVGTPVLLWNSGIGPAEALRDASIDVVCRQPEVGQHLQDHVVYPVVFSTPQRPRFPGSFSWRDSARWQFFGSGPVASNLAEAGGFVRASADAAPDDLIQLHVTPTHYIAHPGENAPAAVSLAVTPARPRSSGAMRPQPTGDGRLEPVIDPSYLTDEDDREQIVRGIEIARQIAATEPLRTQLGDELLPGADASERRIERSIARFTQSLYHPVATCRAGDDPAAVVGDDFRLRGVDDLFIADASVLPDITTGNPHATVMLLAARLAEMLVE